MLKSSHPAAHTLCFQVSCKGAEGAPLIPVPSLVSSESPYFCQALLGPLRPRPDPWGVSDLSKPHVGQVLSYKVQLHLSHKWPLTCHHPPPLTRPTAAPTDQGHPEPTLNLFCVPVWGGGRGRGAVPARVGAVFCVHGPTCTRSRGLGFRVHLLGPGRPSAEASRGEGREMDLDHLTPENAVPLHIES